MFHSFSPPFHNALVFLKYIYILYHW